MVTYEKTMISTQHTNKTKIVP